jgi:hypothetical protein
MEVVGFDPTAPTSLLVLYKGLAKSARQQKAAIRANSVGPLAQNTGGKDGKPTNRPLALAF